MEFYNISYKWNYIKLCFVIINVSGTEYFKSQTCGIDNAVRSEKRKKNKQLYTIHQDTCILLKCFGYGERQGTVCIAVYVCTSEQVDNLQIFSLSKCLTFLIQKGRKVIKRVTGNLQREHSMK